MGKVDRKRSALGNHVRQRQQADMILHGWRAVRMAAAYHPDHGVVAKRDNGEAIFWGPGISANDHPEYCEWDDLSTLRIFWLHKVLQRKGWL